MKKLVPLALVLFALPLFAAIPPDLAALTEEIEHFPTTRGTGSESERLTKFFDLYWAARERELPDEAAYIGYTAVDDRLPDFSPEMLALIHRLAHLDLAALQSIDRSHLTPEEQLSYDLARRRFTIEIEGEPFGSLDPWHNDYMLIDQMNNRITSTLDLVGTMPNKTASDYERIIARLRLFPRVVDQGIARLDEGLKRGITPPKVTLRGLPERMETALKGGALKDLLPQIPETVAPADRERLQRESADVIAHQIVPAIRKLHDYLANTYVPHARESISVAALPDGKAFYTWLLKYYTTTDLTPDEMHQLGLSEVARIRKEMDALIASTGFKGDFHAFCDYLRTDPKFFYTRADDLVAGYRDIAKRIDPELTKLFGKLPRRPYGVKPMESAAQTAPSALYDGVLSGGRPGWMLVNTYNLKARPKWGMESLTAHESVPGHHLMYALAEEIGGLPEWRRWDIYPVMSEGWGLYAEGLGYELGLYKDPYSKFGALNNEMWRAIRLVVDSGLHEKGWTRQQVFDYCKQNSAKTDLEIENEIDRYIVQPGSIPCYKIGAMKIQELRRYAEKELGARFDVRAFHDQILGHGQLPLDLLERSIKTWVASEQARSGNGHS